MPSVPLYTTEGKTTGEISLPDSLFAVQGNPVIVQQAVVTQLANSRRPIAHTKTRGEVRGGGKKPWRQKGTGRARHGSTRSPIWKGGGVTFGPRNTRNFSLKMPAQARRKALAMVLSDKVREKKFVVVDQLQLTQPKTKIFAGIMKKLPLGKTTLLVMPGADMHVYASARNIPTLQIIRANSLNVVEVLRHETLLVPRPAIEVMVSTFAKKSRVTA